MHPLVARIQQAMGSVKDVDCSHGRGLALVYKRWLKEVTPYVEEEFNSIKSLLGRNSVIDVHDHLIEYLGLPIGLKHVGYEGKHIPIILSKITGNLENDPIPNITTSKIQSILELSL